MRSASDDTEVVHNEAELRFEVSMDGHLAVAAYRRKGDVITFTHTAVPEALAGRGVGNRLAQHALDYARLHALRVVPRCPFIDAWIHRHPAYQSLVVANP